MEVDVVATRVWSRAVPNDPIFESSLLGSQAHVADEVDAPGKLESQVRVHPTDTTAGFDSVEWMLELDDLTRVPTPEISGSDESGTATDDEGGMTTDDEGERTLDDLEREEREGRRVVQHVPASVVARDIRDVRPKFEVVFDDRTIGRRRVASWITSTFVVRTEAFWIRDEVDGHPILVPAVTDYCLLCTGPRECAHCGGPIDATDPGTWAVRCCHAWHFRCQAAEHARTCPNATHDMCSFETHHPRSADGEPCGTGVPRENVVMSFKVVRDLCVLGRG
jgi:hypothetical protein